MTIRRWTFHEGAGMQAETDVKSSSTGSDFEEDLNHFFCACNEDVALCGTDLSDAVDITSLEDETVDCIVCNDLVEMPCPLCGEV